jgi:hypothetical protein
MNFNPMKTNLISTEEATELLENYQFDLFSEVYFPKDRNDKVLVFSEQLFWDETIQAARMIPPGTEEVCGIIFQENVKIIGTLSNYIHQDESLTYGIGMNLFFLKNLTAYGLVTTNATVFVAKDLNLEEAAYIFYDNGTSELRVDGTFRAKGLVTDHEHRCRIEEFNAKYDLDSYVDTWEEIEAAIRSDYLETEKTSDDIIEFNHDALVKALEVGKPIFKE